MQLFNLLQVEFIKLKRTSTLFVMLVAPLFTCMVSMLMFIHSRGIIDITEDAWFMWSKSVLAMWNYFMTPLLVALLAALINGVEHRNRTWMLMLSLPISSRQLFFSKFLSIWMITLCSTFLLWLFSIVLLTIISLLGANIDLNTANEILFSGWRFSIALIPLVAILHAISWYFPNIMIALSIGVMNTMFLTQISSSKYWVYFPTSYPLMATAGGNTVYQAQAVELGFIVGLIMLLILGFSVSKKVKEL
ncbi:hypothetical protein SOPP22_15620 [Shewanella sp. OPT22]|nr:hypothetical protein SOPP22_15620 [Shewanella sp. OPT22]